jgi:hypothetical protein
MLRIIRQLAEAERSPVSAVENDDARSVGHQIVEPALDAGRVGERELGSLFTDRRNLALIHETTIAGLARQRNIEPSPTIAHRPPIRIANAPLSLRATST